MTFPKKTGNKDGKIRRERGKDYGRDHERHHPKTRQWLLCVRLRPWRAIISLPSRRSHTKNGHSINFSSLQKRNRETEKTPDGPRSKRPDASGLNRFLTWPDPRARRQRKLKKKKKAGGKSSHLVAENKRTRHGAQAERTVTGYEEPAEVRTAGDLALSAARED